MSLRRRRGFGVLEVLAAGAVLAVIVAATTVCVSQALAQRARHGARRAAVAATAAEVERLRALRFAPETTPPGLDGDGLALGSALGELFPHARPSCDTTGAYCVLPTGPGEVVAFARVTTLPWGTLVVRSRFVEFTPAGFTDVQPVVGDEGWAVWSGAPAPSGALLAVVTATVGDGSWSTALPVVVAEGP